MRNFFFFWILALLLVQVSFISAEDLCEDVSKDYEDLCEEIVDLDLDRDETIDLIKSLDEVEDYDPIPEDRFEKDYCDSHECLIPSDLEYKVSQDKLYFFLEFTIIVIVLIWIFILIKKYGDKIWHLVGC